MNADQNNTTQGLFNFRIIGRNRTHCGTILAADQNDADRRIRNLSRLTLGNGGAMQGNLRFEAIRAEGPLTARQAELAAERV